MCEFETKLIAWIDGELDAEASHQIEDHLEACGACAAKTAGYREVSQAFAAYYDLPLAGKQPARPRRTALYAGSIAAAAAAAVVWMLPFPSAPPPAPRKTAEPAPAIAFVKTAAVPAATTNDRARRRRSVRSVATAKPEPIDAQPTVEIAIPADEIFAPGAFPAGFAFAADLSIRGDGSPEALRVRPASYLK